jgi:hypothetical protein
MDRFEGDVTTLVRNGERLTVRPAAGEVIVLRR